ncbi:hypothetical protein FDF23_11450 [Fusobacterium nucleatum]|nr:hypothetical protein [Fusobacterium nucleatum]MBW9312198.1 hypothetical protein [Fusobacterium nucleatum]
MLNINELIRIIKGINFDPISNDKVILFLQSWVDKNRNLAYDKRQSELIDLIDNLLEEGIIDDDKKNVLLKNVEEFLSDIEGKSIKIYELNNIIEGIIYDGKMDNTEFYHLKEWMEENSDFMKKNKSTEDLYPVIDNILKDGIITEKEQQHLLQLLTDIIKNIQFEAKLNYLYRQVKIRKNIGPDLINILDNESAISKIHNKAEIYLLAALESESNFCINPEIIFISLVLIAMLKYDGNYYDNVRSTYTKVYEKYTEPKIEGFIRFLLNKYKKQDNSGSRSWIINVALENAIVPQTFLSAFFEFIFDIYERNFEHDLPQDLYEEFSFVFEGLRSSMLSEGEDIKLDVTQKTYKLIVATKLLIARKEDLDAVIKLSIIIVKLIDKRFWDKKVKIFNPYLKAGYEGWEKHLKGSAHERHLQRKTVSEFRSRWEPKFYMCDNVIYLNLPIHKVKAQYNYKNIAIIIFNDDKEIYRNNTPDIRSIIGGYQINPPKIIIDNPLGNLTYKLVAGNEIIYDSKDKLHRDYIVFNTDGQEIFNNRDFEGTVSICYRKDKANFNNTISKEYYCIGYKLVRIGDIIAIENDLFNFSSMLKPKIFGEFNNNCFICKTGTKNYISSYKKVNGIVFEADNSSNKFEININGKTYKLSELKYKDFARGTVTRYMVDLKLIKCGIYTIEINQLILGKKKKILRERFVYDNTLEFKVEELNNAKYRLQVRSNLLTEKIEIETTVDKFDFDIIRFILNGEEYSYILPFDIGFYKIDEEKWNPTKEEMWIDDINNESTLKLYDSECDKLILYNENGAIIEDNIKVKNKGFYKEVYIGFLKSYSSNKYVLLVFTVDGKRKHCIFCYNKCEIDEKTTEITLLDDPKKLIITPIFRGKNKVFFEILNKEGEMIYTSKTLASGQTEILENFNSFEKYKFNFYEKTKGLTLKKNTLLFSTEKTFYVKKDFVGKIFKIDIAYYDLFYSNNHIEKKYYFNKVFVKVTNFFDSNIFRGEILIKTIGGEKKLDVINPVEIELCGEIIDDTINVYITNNGDGLLIDVENHKILNAMEHPTAQLISYYSLNMKGKM